MSKYGEGSIWYYEDGWYTVKQLAEKKGVSPQTMRSRIWKSNRGSKVLAAHLAMRMKEREIKSRKARSSFDMSLVKRLNEMWRR